MLNEEYTIWIGNKSDNVTACFVKFRWLFLYSQHIDKHSYQTLIISFLGKATFVMWSRVEGKFVAKSCWLPHLKCYESHHSHFIPSSCSCIIVISVWEARSSKALWYNRSTQKYFYIAKANNYIFLSITIGCSLILTGPTFWHIGHGTCLSCKQANFLKS